MKRMITLLAAAMCSVQMGQCAAPALGGLKDLAGTENSAVAQATGPKSLFGLFSRSSADSGIAQNGVTMPYFLMAPRPAYTPQEAGVNSGYPVLRSHAVIPDRENLSIAINFWTRLLQNAGLKLHSLDAAAVAQGYTLEILYSGSPAIESFDGFAAGRIYETAAAAATDAGAAALMVEGAGGKVLAKLVVLQGDKFSFTVYYRINRPAAANTEKALDLYGMEAGIGVIFEGTHRVGAYISGAASHLANTKTYKADYKGKYKSAKKAVEVLLSAAAHRSKVMALQIYSNETPEGRVFSCLIFWKGWGF